MEVVNPCLTDNLEAKVYSPYIGYEVLQKKNTQIKEVLVKSSYLIPCNSRESGQNEIMKCGVWRDPAALQLPWTDFFKLEIIKKFSQHYLQELIVHYSCFS